VSFYVAIYRQARPDRVQQLLSAIRRSFAASRTAAPGRQAARVFQRLNEPTTLLSLADWDSQAAFEEYRASPAFDETTVDIGPPPTLEYLRRLYLFERMNERAGIVACATITVPFEYEADLYDYLTGPAQREAVQRPSLVSREVYRRVHSEQPRSRFLVVHSWRSLTDLEQFRAVNASQLEENLNRWEATVARFTGAIAVQFSRVHDDAES
jgi:quinol monooxygenase YgiN